MTWCPQCAQQPNQRWVMTDQREHCEGYLLRCFKMVWRSRSEPRQHFAGCHGQHHHPCPKARRSIVQITAYARQKHHHTTGWPPIKKSTNMRRNWSPALASVLKSIDCKLVGCIKFFSTAILRSKLNNARQQMFRWLRKKLFTFSVDCFVTQASEYFQNFPRDEKCASLPMIMVAHFFEWDAMQLNCIFLLQGLSRHRAFQKCPTGAK